MLLTANLGLYNIQCGVCSATGGIRVVSALGRFGPGRFGLRRFGPFLGWVVSTLAGGSFRPIFEVSRFGPGTFRPKSIETVKV